MGRNKDKSQQNVNNIDGYRICSWDVGIKNLAYSVIEKKDGEIQLLNFESIDIMDTDLVRCMATVGKKVDKICGKKACYFGADVDNEIIYYCGTHKSKHQPLSHNWEKNYIVDQDKDELCIKHKCDFILPKKNDRCGKPTKFRCEDMFICTGHKRILINKKMKESLPQKIKSKKVTLIDKQILSFKMYNKLDSINEFLKVHDVLIENQPAKKNSSMKTVSILLFGYFSMRGLIDKKNGSTIRNVKLISPSNKLKINPQNTQKILDKIDTNSKVYKLVKKSFSNILKLDGDELLDKFITEDNLLNCAKLFIKQYVDSEYNHNNFNEEKLIKDIGIDSIFIKKIGKGDEKEKKNLYNINKELGIIYTEVLLENNKPMLDKLYTYKKKDDICDSFLQGYHHLNK